MRRTSLMSFAVALVVAAGSAAAAPTPESLGTLKEKLDKKIKVQFIETPLQRAIDALERDAGVTFVVDRSKVARFVDRPVSLQAEAMSIKTTLDWVTQGAGLDWDVRDGVVYISTKKEILRPHIVMEVYDVRSLTVRPPNFQGGKEFDLNSALSNTSSGGSSGGAQSATTLFSDERTPDVDVQGLQPEELENAIRESINPEDWGGEHDLGVAVKSTSNGLLMVKHTPEVQAKVRDLLNKYQKTAGKMISIDARFMVVRTDALDKLLEENKGLLLFDAAKAATFLKSIGAANAGAGNPGIRVLGTARTLCMNSQRVNVSSSNDQTFLSDLEPVSGGTGVDPTVSVLSSGAVVDVQPDITFDNAAVVLTLRSRVADGNTTHTTPLIAGHVDMEKLAEAPKAPAANAVAKPDEKKPAPPGIAKLLGDNPLILTWAELGLPEQDQVSFATTVRIPDGGAIVLTGVSSAFRNMKIDSGEIVLFLRASIIGTPAPVEKPVEKK